jgi:hypothetical protein
MTMFLGAPPSKSYSDKLTWQCGGEQTRRFIFLN